MNVANNTPNRNTLRSHYKPLVAISVLLAAMFCFYNLGGHSISRADESLYARSVQEMLQNGSWIPTLHGSPFLHKPPLVQLLMALAVKVFGDATWVYRIPTASAGFIYILLIPIFAYRLFHSVGIAALSFAAILSCRMLFASHLIREAAPDGLLVLFLLVGLILGWELWCELSRSKAHSKRAIVLEMLFGTAVLLALFAKSVAGLMSLIIWWVWMLASGRNALLPVRRFIAVFALTTFLPLVIFAAGYFLMLNAVPGTFGAAVHYEVIEKLLGEGHHNTTLPYYYFSQLFVHERAFPALVLGAALLLGLIRAVRGDLRCGYLSISIFVPLLGYSFLHSRLYWYVAPIFAPCAVLIGLLVYRCMRGVRALERSRVSRIGALFGGAAIAVLLGLHTLDIVKGQLVGDRRTSLEKKVSELMALKAADPSVQIIRLCIDPSDQHFKSLLLREWFYLDMLKSVSTSACTPTQVQEVLREGGSQIIVTAPHLESLLPQSVVVRERATVRVDRWKGVSRPDRVRELLFLRIER